MPGGNRRLRTARNGGVPTSIPLIPNDVTLGSSRYSPLGATAIPTLPGLDMPKAPKHIPFPNTPTENNLLFESLIFIYSMISAGLQFLNLYRTVWWLPNSYTNQAMNFYLIDINLVILIFVILSRRIVYILGAVVIEFLVQQQLHGISKMCFRVFLFGLLCSGLTWCAYFAVQNHPVVNILFLCYPITVYLILFGFSISPIFELSPASCDIQVHACTSCAHQIRDEVDSLRDNFNTRMKHILFNSTVNAYYAGFIPCCFSQNYLYYEVLWASVHVMFIFMSCFFAYAVHLLPLKFCDILHKATLHLGSWSRIETRSVLPLTYTWQDDVLWPGSALVKHGKDIYRAQSDTNAAEPGNNMYWRFYTIFKDPSTSLGILLFIHGFVVASQLGILVIFCQYWHHIVSFTFMLFFNYYTLYKMCRDYYISYKIYKMEGNLKIKTPQHN